MEEAPFGHHFRYTLKYIPLFERHHLATVTPFDGTDYGEPVDEICKETAPGVFTREWSKSTIKMDCSTWTPSITMKG